MTPAARRSTTRATSAEVRDRLPSGGAGFRWEVVDHPQTGAVPCLRPEVEGIAAAFTTRVGGLSPEPWDSLNLSDREEPDADRVRANRRIAGGLIGRNGDWSILRQVHGGRVVPAPRPDERPEADALWTDDPDPTLAILVADCVPLLLTSDGRLGLAHAGWRGLVAGVVEAAIEAVSADEVFAGPAIGPCCFEVGPEVVEAFRDRFGPRTVADPRHVDLWAAVEVACESLGVPEVRTARLCTSCHPDLFFSHRRDRGRTGRQGLVAGLVR